MTRYDTTGSGRFAPVGAFAEALAAAGMATTPEASPAGIGVHTATPANTAGIAIGRVRDMTASMGGGAAGGSVTGAAAAQVEKTCWRYAKPRAGSAE